MANPSEPFWKTKSLREMSREEWESLCDGCAKCCLAKLIDDDTGEITYTSVACRLLDLETCTCTNYPERRDLVPDCVALEAKNVGQLAWLPKTCAYLLIHEGEDLPDWHHLVSGDHQTIHQCHQSVKDRVISERDAGDWDDYVIDWIR